MAATPDAALGRPRILRRIAIVVVLGLAIAAALWGYARRWMPDVDDYPVQGVDVSHVNGQIDWKTVRADGAEFAYVLASVGSVRRDAAFSRNWQDAKSAGLRRGAIHEFSLCQLADDQAANFIATVPREAGALPSVVRLAFDEACPSRPDRAVVIGELERLVKAIEAHVEQPVILSLDPDFEEAYRVSEAIDRPLWLRKSYFPPDFGARAWVMWQASSHRHVDGLTGPANWIVLRP